MAHLRHLLQQLRRARAITLAQFLTALHLLTSGHHWRAANLPDVFHFWPH